MAERKSVGFPELDFSAASRSDDSGFQSFPPVQEEQREGKWTLESLGKLHGLIRQNENNSYSSVFINEMLSHSDFGEDCCRTVQEIGDKVTLLNLEKNEFYPHVARMRIQMAMSTTFYLPRRQVREILDLIKAGSPVKLLGGIKGNTNGHPFYDILTPYYERAVMVWIIRYNLLLNSTSGQIRLVDTDDMTFKNLLGKEEIDIMNTINVRVEFLSGETKELTTGEDVITETCVISVESFTD